jgi:hypothetical protein
MCHATARTVVSGCEFLLSVLLLAIGSWLWWSASSPGRDPHGMVAGFGNLALVLGTVVLTAALVLRWRSPWAWAAQLLPFGTAAYVLSLLA